VRSIVPGKHRYNKLSLFHFPPLFKTFTVPFLKPELTVYGRESIPCSGRYETPVEHDGGILAAVYMNTGPGRIS
jgi:hypothetical protein